MLTPSPGGFFMLAPFKCAFLLGHLAYISHKVTEITTIIQARIAQSVAYWLGTGEVTGSNPGKGDNCSMKISN